MTDDRQDDIRRIVGIDSVRVLSLQLFSIIKPKCIVLSELALSPSELESNDSVKIALILEEINDLMHKHYYENKSEGPYNLTSTLADYVFFPITHLFKHQKLGNRIAKHILGILGFLIRFCWSSSIDVKLVDQLYPVILYLVKGEKDSEGITIAKDFEFHKASIYCISHLLNILPINYFQSDNKHLAFLGDTTSEFLQVLITIDSVNSQEEIELVNELLIIMKGLYIKKVNSDQLSHIAPGIISKIINFTIVSKNLHYTILVNILDVLKEIIAKVFNDVDLKVELKDDFLFAPNLDHLNELWEKLVSDSNSMLQKSTNIDFDIPQSMGIRSKEWLTSASVNLKSSLLVLFKNLLVNPNNKLKFRYKSEISNAIVSFVEKISSHSFYSLFNVFNGLSIDIFSLVLTIIDDYDNDILNSFANTVCLNEIESTDFKLINKLELISKNTKAKLNDLIDKVGSVLFSSDDERISIYLMSIKFQFKILDIFYFKLNNRDSLRTIFNLKLKFMKLFQKELADGFIHSSQKGPLKARDVISIFNGEGNVSTDDNRLDDIKLPSYINTKQLARINSSKDVDNKALYSANLLMLSQKWQDSTELLKNNQPLNFLSGFHSSLVESKIIELLEFFGQLKSSKDENSLQFFEEILDDTVLITETPFTYLSKGFSLWISNHYLKSLAYNSEISDKSIDLNEYLTFDDDLDHVNNPLEEIQYLIMGKSQELIDGLADLINKPKEISKYMSFDDQKVYEVTYSIAIDTIGILSNSIPKEDFQSYFLIDYLYPLLESLTYQSNPLIQSHSLKTLQLVTDKYYDGSILSLIDDNLDYLIDCLSLKLTVASNLTPTLPGILLILLKVSGIKLLNTKQLDDIINEMFVLIDSYHGYSSLIEGFFIVFTELVTQVELAFAKNGNNREESDINDNFSRYKPWGLNNVNQLLNLIDSSKKIIDPFSNYSSSKEYFKRKPGIPFDQQTDSDDENSDDEMSYDGSTINGQEKEEEVSWNSIIPKNIYFLIQKIFNYGFRLLLHPSLNLRIQILKAINGIYPLLCTNYSLLLPLITSNWPILMTLIAGSSTLSDTKDDFTELAPEAENLLIPSLEFATRVLMEDQLEGFLSKKFIETWEYLTQHSRVFRGTKFFQQKDSRLLTKVDTSLSRSINPKLLKQYVKFIIAGLNNYQRIIPDLTAYEMVEFCYRIGFPIDQKLGQDVRNILWILENQNKT